jgi:prepilin-type N-terminal cleavage/methylation domain-containing protein
VNRSRRGYSLIEMLVVITVMSMMVVMGTLTMALLMRSERTGGDALVAAQAGHRLARQFRKDVHAADDATLDTSNPGHPVLNLIANGRAKVSWSRVEEGLRRRVDASPAQIETYRVPAHDVSIVLEPLQADSRTRRLIRITTTPETHSRPHPPDVWPIRVTAVLGAESTP